LRKEGVRHRSFVQKITGPLSERNIEFWTAVSQKCIGYSDNDWTWDIGRAAVSWRSNKQTCVALSTPETEYVVLASAVQEATWMR
jgi:FPC/CPF motif-containing protein YcgG